MKNTAAFEMFNTQETDFVSASALAEFSAGSTCTCTCCSCGSDNVSNTVDQVQIEP